MPANIFSNRWGSSQKCRHEEQVGTPERPLLVNRFMSHHPVRFLAIAVPGGPRAGHLVGHGGRWAGGPLRATPPRALSPSGP